MIRTLWPIVMVVIVMVIARLADRAVGRRIRSRPESPLADRYRGVARAERKIRLRLPAGCAGVSDRFRTS
jgi:hypothetical protein